VHTCFQDDAHIFCRVDQVCDICFLCSNVGAPYPPSFLFYRNILIYLQVEEEVKGVLDFIDYVYRIFGFTYELTLSTVGYFHISSLPNLIYFAWYGHVSHCLHVGFDFRGQRITLEIWKHGLKLKMILKKL